MAVVNAAFVGTAAVLGPVVADRTVGRAAYGLVLAAPAAGLVLGAAEALRWRPERTLRAGVALTQLTALPAVALAQAPTVAALLLAGFAIEQSGVAWDVALQQHVPADRLARIYSYDAVGSFVAIPVGEAAVGPLAEHVGLPGAARLRRRDLPRHPRGPVHWQHPRPAPDPRRHRRLTSSPGRTLNRGPGRSPGCCR